MNIHEQFLKPVVSENIKPNEIKYFYVRNPSINAFKAFFCGFSDTLNLTPIPLGSERITFPAILMGPLL